MFLSFHHIDCAAAVPGTLPGGLLKPSASPLFQLRALLGLYVLCHPTELGSRVDSQNTVYFRISSRSSAPNFHGKTKLQKVFHRNRTAFLEIVTIQVYVVASAKVEEEQHCFIAVKRRTSANDNQEIGFSI